MRAPIFVLGTMRSGSTLFRLILDAHPNIAISEETAFMRALVTNKNIASWQRGHEWFSRLGWSEREFEIQLREFYSGMFERYAAAHGKTRWGDKTPLHADYIEEAARIFPDAVFVAIVRHPGAVAHSLNKHFHYTVREAACYWERTNNEIVRQGLVLGDERFALVRYEDIVYEPEPTLRELMEWLSEPWSDDLLRHNEVQAAKGAPRLVDGHTNPRDPIKTERSVRWTAALSEHDKEIIRTATEGLAGLFGYDPSGERPPRQMVPANPAGNRRLLTGGQLPVLLGHADAAVCLPARPDPVNSAEPGTEELLTRLAQAETSLARIRARPIVRFSEGVRRAQRQVSLQRVGRICRRIATKMAGAVDDRPRNRPDSRDR